MLSIGYDGLLENKGSDSYKTSYFTLPLFLMTKIYVEIPSISLLSIIPSPEDL